VQLEPTVRKAKLAQPVPLVLKATQVLLDATGDRALRETKVNAVPTDRMVQPALLVATVLLERLASMEQRARPVPPVRLERLELRETSGRLGRKVMSEPKVRPVPPALRALLAQSVPQDRADATEQLVAMVSTARKDKRANRARLERLEQSVRTELPVPREMLVHRVSLVQPVPTAVLEQPVRPEPLAQSDLPGLPEQRVTRAIAVRTESTDVTVLLEQPAQREHSDRRARRARPVRMAVMELPVPLARPVRRACRVLPEQTEQRDLSAQQDSRVLAALTGPPELPDRKANREQLELLVLLDRRVTAERTERSVLQDLRVLKVSPVWQVPRATEERLVLTDATEHRGWLALRATRARRAIAVPTVRRDLSDRLVHKESPELPVLLELWAPLVLKVSPERPVPPELPVLKETRACAVMTAHQAALALRVTRETKVTSVRPVPPALLAQPAHRAVRATLACRVLQARSALRVRRATAVRRAASDRRATEATED